MTFQPGTSGNPRGRKPKGCGTNGGYQIHRRRGEEPCAACSEARLIAQRAWTAANPDKVKANKKRQYAKHRDRLLARTREWHKANPNVRKRRSLKAYGLTIEQRDAMLATQGGGCAVCGTTNPGHKDWCVDHDHAIGPTAVRGILCNSCNTRLGLLGDDLASVQTWATQGIAYLIDYDLRKQMPPMMPPGVS